MFNTNRRGYTYVYSDGACTNNGTPYAKAGIGVWFNNNNPYNVSRPVRGRATNNVAEIEAATEAAKQAFKADQMKLIIIMDSDFIVKSYYHWIPRWQKNHWTTFNGHGVINKKEFIQMLNAFQSLDDIQLIHIRGHSGNYGNDQADRLAKQGAALYQIYH